VLTTLCIIRLSLGLSLGLGLSLSLGLGLHLVCLRLLESKKLLLLLLLEILRLAMRNLLLEMHHCVDRPHATRIRLHRSQLSGADTLGTIRERYGQTMLLLRLGLLLLLLLLDHHTLTKELLMLLLLVK
jgi:hypothetical protein